MPQHIASKLVVALVRIKNYIGGGDNSNRMTTNLDVITGLAALNMADQMGANVKSDVGGDVAPKTRWSSKR